MGRGRDDSDFPVVGSQARRGRDSGVRARARSRDFWLRGALGAQPVEPAALVTSPSLLKVFGCGSRPFSRCSLELI